MSETPVRIIYNCETGEETIVPLTPEEILDMERLRAEGEARAAEIEAEQAARQAAKESAIAKLSALGLTAEEAAAIVGI